MKRSPVPLIVVLCVILVSVIALSQSVPTHEHPARASILIFSGERNPEWFLSEQQWKEVVAKMEKSGNGVQKFKNLQDLLEKVGLGYQGFLLEIFNQNGEGSILFHIFKNQEMELYLMDTMLQNTKKFQDPNQATLLEHVFLTIRNDGVQPSQDMYTTTGSIGTRIVNNVVRGPDNVTAYDPDRWNKDSRIQYNNNCYNYASDVETDTFAQPGRGSGKKWEYNTCDSVWDASIRDGMIPYSKTTAPKFDEKPEKGHFIALCIWPNYNFHWYKKDLSGYWSHKPGQTRVRNYDNQGRNITDPADADRGPYTIFCGYRKSSFNF